MKPTLHLRQWNFMTTAPVELTAVYRPSEAGERQGGRNETRGANRREGREAGSVGRPRADQLAATEGRQIGIEKQLVRARATQSFSTLRRRITPRSPRPQDRALPTRHCSEGKPRTEIVSRIVGQVRYGSVVAPSGSEPTGGRGKDLPQEAGRG